MRKRNRASSNESWRWRSRPAIRVSPGHPDAEDSGARDFADHSATASRLEDDMTGSSDRRTFVKHAALLIAGSQAAASSWTRLVAADSVGVTAATSAGKV